MVKVSKWLIPQLMVFLILGFTAKVFLAFLFIIIHELFHYLMAVKVGARVEDFKVHPLGTTIEISNYDELSPKEEILICFAGPLTNLLLAGMFFIVKESCGGEFLYNCFEVNLVLGVFNLLPAFPLDGSKILRASLSSKMLYKRAYNATIVVSFIIGFLFLSTFFVGIYIHRVNLILVLFGVFIIYITYREKGKVMYIIMGDIIKKRRRLINKKYIDNKFLAVYYKQELLYVLGLVDKNKFNVFYVLNEEMRLLYIISEDELIDALKFYGNITLQEYIERKKDEK